MPEAAIPIVIAAPPMHTGGTERHLLYILPGLKARGFEITVVLLGGGGLLEDELRATGIRVVKPALERERPWRTLAQAMLIRRTLGETGARVLHAFLSEPYLAASVARMLTIGRRPALIHARRSLAFYAARHPMAKRMELLAHAAATKLIGNSTAVAKELIAECGRPDKVEIIRNGIPLPGPISDDERREARQLFGIGEDELVLAMVSNFYPYKGHADLIDALRLAAPGISQPFRLLLAGRDAGGPDAGVRDALQSVINAHNLTANVTFIGEWPGSRQPFAAADIGLLVSHTEGFSNSLIEGMAGGLPMIATAVGGNLDAVIHNSTGVMVPVQSPELLSEAILRLAGDPELRQRLGDAARESAERQFSLDACVGAYERLWRGLVA